MRKRLFLICFAMIIIMCSCTKHEAKEIVPRINKPYDFTAHILSLENGTCFVFELPDNECMLVDCGSSDDFPKVYSALKDLNIHDIDYLIITKCDYLHCGGINKIFENLNVKKCFVPKASKGKIFRTVVERAKQFDVNIDFVFSGIEIMHHENLFTDVVSPDENSRFDAISLFIKYGDTSFFVDGEVEEQIQNEVYTNLNKNANADVVVLCANTEKMISASLFQKIDADFAVINNIRGLNKPLNIKILNSLEVLGAYSLRTDTLGSIKIKSNQYDIKINTQY